MANKIIVIRTLKQLDYLLTKFKNNIEVYTKEEQIDASKVIKYCAVDRKVIANRASLIIKIAGEENGEIVQTSDEVKEALKKWFEVDGAAAAGTIRKSETKLTTITKISL